MGATPGFEDRVLSKIKDNHWSAMCGYTHSGGLQVQRWQSDDAVEPGYTLEEVAEVLSFAEIVGSVAAAAILGVGGDEPGADTVLQKFRERLE